jgi:hypothetical protein
MATLQVRLGDFITAVGTDIKTLRTYITGSSSGNLTALATTYKTDIVGAINEVRTAALLDQSVDATTTVKGKTELATDAEALAMSSAAVVLMPSNLAAIVNVNNGLLKLDATGKVAAAQLPGFVDDVLEYANLAAFPGSGTTGVLYTAIDTNKVYRWTGSVYVEISASPGSTDAVPEGSTNLYYTAVRADARVTAGITAAIGNPDVDLAAAYATAKT